jgi:hypothetical protein
MVTKVLRSAGVTASFAPLSEKDRKAASKLKPEINELMKRVRLGKPLENQLRPEFKNGSWQTAKGHKLAEVRLSTAGNTSALVDPKNNSFFYRQSGDVGAPSVFHGPLALPSEVQFSKRAFDSLDIKQIETLAQKGRPRVNIDAIPTSITGPNGNAALEGSLFVNLMPGPGSGSRNAIASIDLSGNGFDDTIPKYKVSKLQVFEQGTNTLVATVEKPKPTDQGIRDVFTGFEKYRVEIPKEKLDITKKYTVVAQVSINGSPLQSVRTDYMGVGFAF